MAGAPVSVPVTWDELEGTPPRFDLRSVFERLEQVGDLFRGSLAAVSDLRRATVHLELIAHDGSSSP